MARVILIFIFMMSAACGGGAGSSAIPEISSGLDAPKLYLFYRLGGISGIQDLKKKPPASNDPSKLDEYWKCMLKAVPKKLPNEILETLTQEYSAHEQLIDGEINRSRYNAILSEVETLKTSITNREKTYLSAMEGGLARCEKEYE